MASRRKGQRDRRGNSHRKRARKHWLLSPEAGFGGNNHVVPCIYCATMLDYAHVESDRIIAGGSYARENVIPACRKCNHARGNKTLWSYAPTIARRLHRRGYVISASDITKASTFVNIFPYG